MFSADLNVLQLLHFSIKVAEVGEGLPYFNGSAVLPPYAKDSPLEPLRIVRAALMQPVHSLLVFTQARYLLSAVHQEIAHFVVVHHLRIEQTAIAQIRLDSREDGR